MKPPPCVLTIAGSDSGAGAGIQADARTIHALGGYALTVITAVTAQNTRRITAWSAVTPGLVAAQIAAVLGDFPIAAIKTGLLPSAAVVRAVAVALTRYSRVPLVIDPVLGSTSGTRFLSGAGLRTLRDELLPRATLITPNWPEAETLTSLRVRTFVEAEIAAKMLATTFGCAVLVKGGHGPGATCRDYLATPDGRVRWFEGPRIATRNTHGTGCVLSAAIASRLAHHDPLPTAVRRAQAFLQKQLRAGRRTRWGGPGPAFAGAK